MPKVDIDLVQSVIDRQDDIPLEARKRLINELLVELKNEAELAAEEKEPAVKKQFVVLLSDPLELLVNAGRGALNHISAFVVQLAEDDPAERAIDRLEVAAQDVRRGGKARHRGLVKPIDALEAIPAKVAKAAGLWIKTREPVACIRLPEELRAHGEDDVERILRGERLVQGSLPGVSPMEKVFEGSEIQRVSIESGGKTIAEWKRPERVTLHERQDDGSVKSVELPAREAAERVVEGVAQKFASRRSGSGRRAS